MEKKEHISKAVTGRLPRYYRFLCDLEDRGVERISSKGLSEKMGTTASQIRQDLNCFGGFGQQGYGYNVRQLKSNIAEILGLSEIKTAIMIGAGNMSKALVNHFEFRQKGFNLIGIFDKNPALSGHILNGFPIRHIDLLDEFCRENRPDAAVLCIPKKEAQAVADQLVRLGVKGFWNFSHSDLKLPKDVAVENVHIGDSLMTLCYKLESK